MPSVPYIQQLISMVFMVIFMQPFAKYVFSHKYMLQQNTKVSFQNKMLPKWQCCHK